MYYFVFIHARMCCQIEPEVRRQFVFVTIPCRPMTSLTITGTRHWGCNKKTNPSANKLLKEYSVVLETPGAKHPIKDEVSWQAKDSGRDWYGGKSYPIGLKMCRHAPNCTSNHTEWTLWEQNTRVRANTPRCYGRFLVSAPEHNMGDHVVIDVLVQDRVGPSLGGLLSDLCADESSWNHAIALQVVRHWSNTLALADALAECRFGWAQAFYVCNACLSLCGERMLWCNWETLGPDPGPLNNMKTALKKLQTSLKHLVTFPPVWQLWHEKMFECLRSASEMAAIQNSAEWWHPIMIEALTEYGPPPMVVNSLNPTLEEEEDDGWLVVQDNVNTN